MKPTLIQHTLLAATLITSGAYSNTMIAASSQKLVISLTAPLNSKQIAQRLAKENFYNNVRALDLFKRKDFKTIIPLFNTKFSLANNELTISYDSVCLIGKATREEYINEVNLNKAELEEILSELIGSPIAVATADSVRIVSVGDNEHKIQVTERA